jgi:hypothetical protein
MIRVTAQTSAFHAIKFVDAIRRATGIGLKQGLDHVRRLSEGEALSIYPAQGISDEELASWLDGCGVAFKIQSSDSASPEPS